MKNIYIMLLMICAMGAFSACSDDDKEIVPESPKNLVKVPPTAVIGGEVTVRGNIFTDASKLYLKNETGEETEVTVTIISKVDVVFALPEDFPKGVYTLMLHQGTEKFELGTLSVVYQCPITDYELKEGETDQGEMLVILGTGFADDCEVYLEPAEGERIRMTNVENTEEGLQVTIPADFALGTYDVYVNQVDLWFMGMVKIVVPGPKPVRGIRIIDEMFWGDPYITEITFSRDEQGRIVAVDFGDSRTWTIDYSIEGKIVIDEVGSDYSGDYTAKLTYTLINGTIFRATEKKDYMARYRGPNGIIYLPAVDNSRGKFTFIDDFLTGINTKVTTKVETKEDESDEFSSLYTTDGTNILQMEDKLEEYTSEFEYGEGAFTNNVAGDFDLWTLISRQFNLSDFNYRLLGIAGKYPAQLPDFIIDNYSWTNYELTYTKNKWDQLESVKMQGDVVTGSNWDTDEDYYGFVTYELLY